MRAVAHEIASPDVVIARCFQLLLVVEVIRLWLLCIGLGGPRVYDHPKPSRARPQLYDWAVVEGWPA